MTEGNDEKTCEQELSDRGYGRLLDKYYDEIREAKWKGSHEGYETRDNEAKKEKQEGISLNSLNSHSVATT